MTTAIEASDTERNIPDIKQLMPGAPQRWLRKGLSDFLAYPIASLFYGTVFVLMGYALAWLMREAGQMVLALAGGFLLVGPFLATGLYEISRLREAGQPMSLFGTLLAWRRNVWHIGVFAAFLGLILALWVRLAALVFAVAFVGSMAPGVGDTMGTMFLTGTGLKFTLVFFLVGAVVAAFVFAVSVVSVPMLLDRKTDALTAVTTSLAAVRQNPRTMLVWAGCVAGLTLLGMLPAFLGLAVAVPVLGHATWHAYRDLVAGSRR